MENIETTETVEIIEEKKPNFLVRGSKKVVTFVRSKTGKASLVVLGLAAATIGTYAAGFRNGTDNTLDVLAFDVTLPEADEEESESSDDLTDDVIDDAPEDSSSE